MNKDKLLGALSMCRKAGMLTMGFDAVAETAAKGKAYSILVASDTSVKTIKRVRYFCEDYDYELVIMPVTIDDLLRVTPKAVGVFSIIDENFSKLVLKKVAEINENSQPLKED